MSSKPQHNSTWQGVQASNHCSLLGIEIIVQWCSDNVGECTRMNKRYRSTFLFWCSAPFRERISTRISNQSWKNAETISTISDNKWTLLKLLRCYIIDNCCSLANHHHHTSSVISWGRDVRITVLHVRARISSWTLSKGHRRSVVQ